MSAYTRQVERQGSLPLRTKLAQALGACPVQVVDWAFATFLLLFYSQVLGLPAGWASVALTIAVLADAFIDLGVGSFSDGLKTRLGRRHPLMYAAIIPLLLTIWALFHPPRGLDHVALFAWLIGFALASRVALTLFAIPWAALFPELTDNYVERSEILAYRLTLGVASVAGFQAVTWGLIFKETGGQVGQLVEANYAVFAPVLAALVAGTVALTTVLTHREVKYLRQPTTARGFSLRTMITDLADALRNRNFLLLFIALLISQTITGTNYALRLYTYTFFWGLKPDDLKYFAVAGVGALLALGAIAQLNKRFEKRDLLVFAIVLNQLDNLVVVSLRFLHVLPENGDPRLVAFLVANETFHAFMVVVIATLFYSMVADTVDEQELRTGSRQEGVFSAAIGFSSKAITGLGVMGAGVLLQFFIGMPRGITPATTPPEAIMRLGVVVGFGLPFLYLIPAAVAYFYTLNRARHADILRRIGDRARGQTVSPPDPLDPTPLT